MYDLDLTGKLPDNLVENERTIIANCQNRYRCFIPVYAPFFADSLVLNQITNGQVNELVEGIHFYLGHYYAEGEATTKRRVYGSICLKEPLTGVLVFRKYQTMGGPTTASKVSITKHLGDPELVDPRNIDWSVVQDISPVTLVLDTPESYPEAIGSDEIIASIEDITQVLLKTSTKDSVYSGLKQAVMTTQQRMVSEGYYTHATTPVAHSLTPDLLGVYKRGDTVADALQAFGYSLNELGNYCVSKGVDPAILDKYFAPGDTFTGIMHLSDTQPVVLPDATITKSVSGLTIAVKGNIALVADTAAALPGKTSSLHSGDHILSVYSAGANRSAQPASLDGYDLITKSQLSKYTSWLESTGASLALHTHNTATVTLSGDGTAGNPLRGTVAYPQATQAVDGIMRVTNSAVNMPAGYGCSTRTLYELERTVAQFALGIYRLNGRALSSDVSLTLSDFGLGAVNNTKLEDKPLSTAWSNAVNGLASATHKHYINTLVPSASPTTAGVFTITNDLNKHDSAASIALAATYSAKLTALAATSIRFVIGNTLQLGNIPADAPRLSKQGIFIAIEVA